MYRKQEKNTAPYCRLSQDDELLGDSKAFCLVEEK